MNKTAQLVKIARQNREERNRQARANYRNSGAAGRRERKIKQRIKRRQGGATLKNRVKIQQKRLETRPVRIRKEPLQKRLRDRS